MFLVFWSVHIFYINNLVAIKQLWGLELVANIFLFLPSQTRLALQCNPMSFVYSTGKQLSKKWQYNKYKKVFLVL